MCFKDFDKWFEAYTGADIVSKVADTMYCAYCVHEVYCEGINKLDILPPETFKPYSKGKSLFTCCVGTHERLLIVLNRISDSLRDLQGLRQPLLSADVSSDKDFYSHY